MLGITAEDAEDAEGCLLQRLACNQRIRSSDHAHETSKLFEVLPARFRFHPTADIDRSRSDLSDRLPHVLGIEPACENDPSQPLGFDRDSPVESLTGPAVAAVDA